MRSISSPTSGSYWSVHSACGPSGRAGRTDPFTSSRPAVCGPTWCSLADSRSGLGSAYYHLAPGNETLFWDRLPLAVMLMGLLSATIAERVSVKAGLILLGPLVLIGIASVL